MIDDNGTYAYSNLVSTYVHFQAEIAYPSPTSDFFRIKADQKSFPCTVSLVNQEGKYVSRQRLDSPSSKFNLETVASGLYIVMMNSKTLGKIVVK